MNEQADGSRAQGQRQVADFLFAQGTVEDREFVHAAREVAGLGGEAPVPDHELAELERVSIIERVFSADVRLCANSGFGSPRVSLPSSCQRPTS